MTILVTRPLPDSQTTAEALRARGLNVIVAPMLRLEEVSFEIDDDSRFGAVMVTSANALRAIANRPELPSLLALPVFTVGGHTAEAARQLGFANVTSADGDATSLRKLLDTQGREATLSRSKALLYLAGVDLSRNLSAELSELGFDVVTVTTYKMAPVPALPQNACDMFNAGDCAAVMHYSRRSARAFLAAARADGLEISALALPQICISDAVAAELREAGAPQLQVAASPDEIGIFDALDRALTAISR